MFLFYERSYIFLDFCERFCYTFVKGVDKMFENFDLDTIGYIQYMEQAEKEKQESDKSGKEQDNDIRLSQNEYNRPTFR